MNKETLNNAFQLFEKEGMLEKSSSQDTKGLTAVRLTPEWAPKKDEKTGDIIPEGNLWRFAETIAQSRREG